MSFLLQPLRPFEFTSPVYDQIKNWLLWPKPISSLIFHYPWLRSKLTRRVINERILETPFILQSLPPPPAKILDVGACESPLSLMLASLGYQITALDTRPYPFHHPRLNLIQSDITRMTTSEKYDYIICLSVLEHIGLEVYGNLSLLDLDQQALTSMFNLLRPGGTLLLTTPVDITPGYLPGCRVYTVSTLKKYLSHFSRVSIKIGVRDSSQNWHIVNNLPRNFKSAGNTPSAVALITAVK